MLAAFLEWVLWLLAFVYCLVKVYIKAEHWTVKLLAFVVGLLFVLLRSV
jgi:chitin synthase